MFMDEFNGHTKLAFVGQRCFFVVRSLLAVRAFLVAQRSCPDKCVCACECVHCCSCCLAFKSNRMWWLFAAAPLRAWSRLWGRDVEMAAITNRQRSLKRSQTYTQRVREWHYTGAICCAKYLGMCTLTTQYMHTTMLQTVPIGRSVCEARSMSRA